MDLVVVQLVKCELEEAGGKKVAEDALHVAVTVAVLPRGEERRSGVNECQV